MVIFGSVMLKVLWSNFFSKTGDYEGSDGITGSCILEATRIAADSCEYLEMWTDCSITNLTYEAQMV
jgi:hypothetical protein